MTVCLVTGGAGFIGSHLVDALVAQGEVVRVLDNFSTGSLRNLEKVRSKIELIRADVTDAAVVRAASQGAQVVFHLAALDEVHLGATDPLARHHASATGTLQVLLAARDAGVKRVIYAASANAYGNLNRLPWRETDPTDPVSLAAVAKLTGEQYCVAFTRLYGLETIRLRYFRVYGPRQSPSIHTTVIPQFLEDLLKGRGPVLYGDGSQSRDFTYVDDVVQATLLAARVQRGAGKVYNISFGRRTSLLELVHCANGLLGTKIQPVHVLGPPGYLRHSQGDITQAQADLGYCPYFDIQLGLEHCLAHLQAHK
jgi:UDP-glucose 4-epimerase